MGKKNNVNPNHYKTAGRDRPGDNLLQHQHRLDFTQAQAELRREATEMTMDAQQASDAVIDVVPQEDDVGLEEQPKHPAGSG